MQLTDLCVSRELAGELKTEGFPQDACFYWYEVHSEYRQPEWHIGDWVDYYNNGYKDSEIAAPTAAEIGEQLPDYIDGMGILSCEKCNDGSWCVEYELMHGEVRFVGTEANARAKMWLFLKRNGMLNEGIRP